jgi:hypothetical protein
MCHSISSQQRADTPRIRESAETRRYRREMARTCARPGCNVEANAMFNFDGLARVVWLAPLDDSGRSAGDLCRNHADRLRPPLRWELRDLREDARSIASTKRPKTLDATSPLLQRAFRGAKAS